MKHFAVLGVALILVWTSACASGVGCENPQTPRKLDPQTIPTLYDGKSTVSTVELTGPDSLTYRPRAGGPEHKLERCGQHYHLPIENWQGCAGEPGPLEPGSDKPMPGDWVEVHTVFAAEVNRGNCDPETLGCCKAGPFLVRAFNARVIKGSGAKPIIPPDSRPIAQWSGSTTGAESEPDECKPAAQWSFHLGCDFRVSEGQLDLFKHADPARPLQSGKRLSDDLTLVE